MKGKELAKRVLGSRLLKWGVVILAVGIGGWKISEEWHDVNHALGQIGLLASFEALLALLVMQFATLRTWQVLLAGFGSPLRTPVAGRILFIGQLGKYVPGSVWPVLAQMELGAAAKVPRTRSASASILTMLLSLLTGLVIAMVTLPFAQHSAAYLWIFILVPVIVVCLHPRVLNPLLDRLFKLAKRPGLDTPLTGRVLAHALAWSFTAWIFNGLQCWILAEKFGAPVGRTILIALGGYAFAWCVGFVIVIAPAGAGFRDVLLIAALTPVIGSSPATAVMLVSRAVNTVSDLLVAGVAAAGHHRRKTETAGEGKHSAGNPAEFDPAEVGATEVTPAGVTMAEITTTPVTTGPDSGPLRIG
jgi:glycosyltransferase 2 family protein